MLHRKDISEMSREDFETYKKQRENIIQLKYK